MYDLETDPMETRNLYGMAEHADLQRHLQERMEALSSAIPQGKQI